MCLCVMIQLAELSKGGAAGRMQGGAAPKLLSDGEHKERRGGVPPRIVHSGTCP